MTIGWREIWIGLLCFTLMGLMFAAQFRLFFASLGEPITWGQCLMWELGFWYVWALLCPAILWLCRHIPLTRTSWLWAIGAHLVGGLFVASIHVVLYAGWTSLAAPLVVGEPGWLGAVKYLSATYFAWELFGYAGIVAA